MPRNNPNERETPEKTGKPAIARKWPRRKYPKWAYKSRQRKKMTQKRKTQRFAKFEEGNWGYSIWLQRTC